MTKVFKTKVKPLKRILGFKFVNKKIKMVVKLENNNNNNWNGQNLAAQFVQLITPEGYNIWCLWPHLQPQLHLKKSKIKEKQWESSIM